MTMSNTIAAGINSYKVPINSTSKQPTFRNSQEDARDLKKISAQEMQHRRNNGQCFKCGENQCKVGYSNCMLLEEENDSAFEDALGKQDEQIGNLRQTMEMSLHAIF